MTINLGNYQQKMCTSQWYQYFPIYSTILYFSMRSLYKSFFSIHHHFLVNSMKTESDFAFNQQPPQQVIDSRVVLGQVMELKGTLERESRSVSGFEPDSFGTYTALILLLHTSPLVIGVKHQTVINHNLGVESKMFSLLRWENKQLTFRFRKS